MKMMIFGPPGAGKGTQAEMLENTLSLPRITTGDIMRQAASESPLIAQTLREGALIPDELVGVHVHKRLSHPDCAKGFILDGFPRTKSQAEFLTDKKIIPDVIIVIEAPDEVILSRLATRLIHLPSGRTYNQLTAPPKVAGTDDLTGEPLTTREDDQPEQILNRINVYREHTLPVLKYYEGHSDVHIHRIDGAQAPAMVGTALLDLLGKGEA